MKVTLNEQQIKLIIKSLPNDNKCAYIKSILRDYTNPIIDNRIVSDITFATRFKNFLKGVTVNDGMSEEELDYLKSVANRLLAWQKNTIKDENESAYFKRLEKK